MALTAKTAGATSGRAEPKRQLWSTEIGAKLRFVASCALAGLFGLLMAQSGLAALEPVRPTPSTVASLSSLPPVGPPSSGESSDSSLLPADVLPADMVAALVGHVHDERSPLQSAGVYAYRLVDLTLRKVTTDEYGAFSFQSLPAGLYKIIAHKSGFLPAVVLLKRASASVFQELELQLRRELDAVSTEPGSFWKIRERIPRDVLREITLANAQNDDLHVPGTLSERMFETRLEALQGYGEFGTVADAELTGGRLGMHGRLGQFEVDLQGVFRELELAQSASSLGGKLASSHALALTFAAPSSSKISVSGLQNRMFRGDQAVDFERVGVSWSQDVSKGHSAISAEIIEEANFYTEPRLEPLGAASASRTFKLEGTYETRLGRSNSLQTGIRYRERTGLLPLTRLPWGASRERFEVFGNGSYDVQPSMRLQYGLLTTVDDGALSFAPEAGIVLELGSKWLAESSLRHRLSEDQQLRLRSDFLPAYFRTSSECTSAEANCYRVQFTRKFGQDESVSFGALHRVFGDTLRMFFSDDFFDRLDSLVFVQGDRLPELRFSISSRLAPSIMARFESNFARGGGGLINSAELASFENLVRYLVTSIDTRFEATDTGLLLAFHSLQQELAPYGHQVGLGGYGVDLDRLQLLVTQDLPALLGLSTDWALKLDMQISRGGGPLAALDDERRRRIAGGIAVRF